MTNHGVIPGKLSSDWIGGDIPWEDRNPTADWSPYLVVGEHQSWGSFDCKGCVSFATNNTCEIQIKHQTGVEFNDSDRMLAKESGTTQDGNYVSTVLLAKRDNRTVREAEWTTPPNPDWNSYYAEIPQAIKDRALKTQPYYDLQWEYITDLSPENIRKQLHHAPLLITIPGHEVTGIKLEADNQTLTILDDYVFNVDPNQPFVRKINLSDVTHIYKAVITMKGENMVGYKKQGDATTYIEIGGKFVALADFNAFEALGGSSGSIVELTQEQFDKFPKVETVLFKSK